MSKNYGTVLLSNDRGNWVVLVIHRPEQAKEPIIYLQPISETSELE
jgi:hypothetical protein